MDHLGFVVCERLVIKDVNQSKTRVSNYFRPQATLLHYCVSYEPNFSQKYLKQHYLYFIGLLRPPPDVQSSRVNSSYHKDIKDTLNTKTVK